jgi:hypothetical protein
VELGALAGSGRRLHPGLLPHDRRLLGELDSTRLVHENGPQQGVTKRGLKPWLHPLVAAVAEAREKLLAVAGRLSTLPAGNQRKEITMSNQPHLGTLALHAGQKPDPTTGARAVPIYATTSYVFKDTDHAANLFALKEFGKIYSRLMNPTNDVLEQRLAALDGGAAALAFASGQAAITAAILTLCHAGQNFISATSLYGGTWTLFTQTLTKLGIEVRFFDPNQPEDISKLVDANTRCVYLESLGNPKNDVPDFQKIAAIAHRHGLPTIIDNTVMTPALLRPIEHGMDIVVYSTTKFIGGHGAHIGGAKLRPLRRVRGRAHWRRNCGQRQVPVGHGRGEVAGVLRARPGVSRRRVRGSAAAHRQHRVHHSHPDALVAGYRRVSESVRGVPIFAGVGDAASAVAAAL